jgi:hypothetical protein
MIRWKLGRVPVRDFLVNRGVCSTYAEVRRLCSARIIKQRRTVFKDEMQTVNWPTCWFPVKVGRRTIY